MSKSPKCQAGCQAYYGGEIEHHPDCVYYAESFTKRYDDLKIDNARLKEFAQRVIRQTCWGQDEPDGGDIQTLAEKLGLIKSVVATEDDVNEESYYEVGDIIYKFTDLLKNGEWWIMKTETKDK